MTNIIPLTIDDSTNLSLFQRGKLGDAQGGDNPHADI